MSAACESNQPGPQNYKQFTPRLAAAIVVAEVTNDDAASLVLGLVNVPTERLTHQLPIFLLASRMNHID
jgi:hypothetical protein